jgi:hypothetical protein
VAQSDDPPPPSSQPGDPLARASRTNLLLAAAIESDTLKVPVRIRNLSETGAMIDGAAFPPIGATLILRRLDISVKATVVWHASGRCGIRFEGQVSVPDWVAGVSRADAGAMPGQVRVDAIQAAPRTGGQPPIVAPRSSPAGPKSDIADERLADELAYVYRLLDGVSDELADDPVVLQRYMRSLQNLDIAGQIIEQLAAVLRASDRGSAVNALTMEELRARLLRKSMF